MVVGAGALGTHEWGKLKVWDKVVCGGQLGYSSFFKLQICNRVTGSGLRSRATGRQGRDAMTIRERRRGAANGWGDVRLNPSPTSRKRISG